MNWQPHPLAIPLLVAAIPLISFALVVWRRRNEHISVAVFVLVMALVVGLLLTHALELLSSTLPMILFWIRWQYVFLLPIPTTWLLFAFAYTGSEDWIRPKRALPLYIIPAFNLLIVWTNEFHHLQWQWVGLSQIGNFYYFERQYGFGFWIGTFYNYAVLIVATGVLIQAMRRAPKLQRAQVFPLLLAALFPWLGSIVTVFNLSPISKLNMIPYGLVFACLAMSWSITRYRLFDLVPAAYDKIVKSMRDAIIVVDRQSRIVDVNPAAEQVTQLSAAALLGKPIDYIISGVPSTTSDKTKTQELRDEWQVKVGEEKRYFDIRLSPLRDHQNKLVGQIVVLRDITERKQAEQTIRKYADELEARNRELDMFSHTVAHDLKNPLNQILGYAELIELTERGKLSPIANENLANIQFTALRMGDMIYGLLLLASLRDASKVMTTVDMNATARAALDRLRYDAAKRGVEVELAQNFPPAYGYAPWIEEVLANLISNAIKYIGKANESPHVSIRGVAQGKVARYEVRDNGVGITSEQRARLFQMFTRFHESEASGSGLGLTIVQRIVERLGGEVGVESTPGKGSTFWFTLPATNNDLSP